MRRSGGRETWHRLRDWDEGSGKAERLAAQILIAEGFTSVDPSHPLGGRDGLKDIVCERDGRRWRAAAWFPRGERKFSQIQKKFKHDLGYPNDDDFVFVCNQELRLDERKTLRSLKEPAPEIYHLERVSDILNSPAMYGVRFEYLD